MIFSLKGPLAAPRALFYCASAAPSRILRRAARLSLLALAISAGGAGAEAANLLANGDFEAPPVPAGSFTRFATGSLISGWRVVGAAGNVDLISGTYVSGAFTATPRSGQQWLDLTGISHTATGVAQTVPTTAGRLYELSFHVGNVVNPGGPLGVTSLLRVFVNGTPLMTATNGAGAGQNKVVWRRFSATIVASGPNTTITFLNGDSAADDSCGLDDVTLIPLFAVGE